jgi:hypothetical protein
MDFILYFFGGMGGGGAGLSSIELNPNMQIIPYCVGSFAFKFVDLFLLLWVIILRRELFY